MSGGKLIENGDYIFVKEIQNKDTLQTECFFRLCQVTPT